MFAQVVALEDDAGAVGEPFGGDLAGLGVDPGDPPAVAVADLVDPIAAPVVAPGLDGQGGVVVAADDDVAGADILIAGDPHGGGVAASVIAAVQALVDGVGDFPRVADDRRIVTVARGRWCRRWWRRRPSRSGHRCAAGRGCDTSRPLCAAGCRAPTRSASEASRSSGSRIRHTSPRRCAPRQFIAQVLEHAAARFDRRQLVGVADQDHFGAPVDRACQQFLQFWGADHGGFVDDDDGATGRCAAGRPQ